MVLIIFSPISSHVKQKEGGETAVMKHTHSLHVCGALWSTKQAERRGTMKQDQWPNTGEGERNDEVLASHSPPGSSGNVSGRRGKWPEMFRLCLTRKSPSTPKDLFSLHSCLQFPGLPRRPLVALAPGGFLLAEGRCWRSSLPTSRGKLRLHLLGS